VSALTTAAQLAAELSGGGAWEERFGSLWLDDAALDVRHMAEIMIVGGARFVTLTAQREEGSDAVRMSYHWDLDGQLLTVATRARDGRIPSIHPLCPAADWIEREVQEGFKVEFEGRPYEPLLLRHGDALGVNLRSEEDE
jgi:hypothetical protein